MATVQAATKEAVGSFDDWRFSTGESADPEAMVALLGHRKGGTPYFRLFKDGLKTREILRRQTRSPLADVDPGRTESSPRGEEGQGPLPVRIPVRRLGSGDRRAGSARRSPR
ncbi:hypothetical protein [Streptomyces sp. NBC_00388]|uniref:hypothetical protein n=1 Tax=Streptomyces sp. NBC_00388 TaxID=2975735 RepID=UPI003FA7351C